MKTSIQYKHFFFILLLSTLMGYKVAGQDTQIIGDSQSDLLNNYSLIDNHLYTIFQNEENGQPSVIKEDLSGNLIWQLDLSIDFFASDIAKQGSTLLVTGNNSAGNNSSRNSVLAKITDNGSTATIDFIREYNISGRDDFTRVIAKPGSTTNFLVQHFFKGIGDDVAILEFDNSGTMVSSTSYDGSDDQFWGGLKAGQTTLTLRGNMGGSTSGCFVELQSNLSVNEAYQYSPLSTITDYLDQDVNRKVLIGYTSGLEGVIFEAGTDGAVNWAQKIPEARTFNEIKLLSSSPTANGFIEKYLISGQEEVSSGVFRMFIMQFTYEEDNSMDIFSIDWTKYINDGSTSSDRTFFEFDNNNIYWAENKINSPYGYGGRDVFQLNTDASFSSCFTTDLNFTVESITLSPTEITFNESTITLPTAIDLMTASAMTYSFGDPCEDFACMEDTLIINTGYDPTTESIYAQMTQDGFWILVDAPPSPPNPAVSLGAPTWNIEKHPAWANPPYNSTYISAFPDPGSNMANIGGDPYVMRRCFCVEEDNTELEFSVDVHVDNQMALYFFDPTLGTRTFLDDVMNGSSSNNFKGAPEHLNINNITVPTAGKYCLEAELFNDHEGSPMGINISGWVKGASLITDGCCSDSSYIAGFKYRDHNCDGAVGFGDPIVGNWMIELYDDQNTLVETVSTDANGYYVFQVEPGTYTVKEVLQTDWEFSVPANGEHSAIVVGANEVKQLDFGNIYTGPIITEAISGSCLAPGENITLNWSGQVCDCSLQLQVQDCAGTEPWQTVADMTNTGSYTWTIPDFYSGDYSFQILDCDGNQIPFEGCINVDDFDLQIVALQTGCGTYDFSYELEGIATNDINSIFWSFDIYGTNTSPNPSFDFTDAGDYQINLTITSNTGCERTATMSLNVAQGSSDPECNFCGANVLSEIDSGDLYIYDDCFGLILKSPNGTCFRLKVGDDGTVTAQAINCP